MARTFEASQQVICCLDWKKKTSKIPQQEYAAEFKELTVKPVKSGQSLGAVAKELEQTLGDWIKAAKVGKLRPPSSSALIG